MKRTYWMFSVLASFALAGCDLLSPGDGPLPNIALAVSDTVVTAPSSIRVSGRNITGESLLYNACVSAKAYRLESGEWSDRPSFPGSRACTLAGYSLSAGETLEFALAIPSGIAPGTYRVQMTLTADDNREALAVSAPFQVQ
jgi:hypothetical protein